MPYINRRELKGKSIIVGRNYTNRAKKEHVEKHDRILDAKIEDIALFNTLSKNEAKKAKSILTQLNGLEVPMASRILDVCSRAVKHCAIVNIN